jgi:hypothetical protein
MAKVIKINETKAKRRTHTYCGAVIEYFQNEVESKVENEPYGGGTDTYHYLTCPNCGKRMRWCGSV